MNKPQICYAKWRSQNQKAQQEEGRFASFPAATQPVSSHHNPKFLFSSNKHLFKQLSSKVAPVLKPLRACLILVPQSIPLLLPRSGRSTWGRDPIWKNLNESIRMEQEARRGGSRKVLKGLSGLGAGRCGVLLGAVWAVLEVLQMWVGLPEMPLFAD